MDGEVRPLVSAAKEIRKLSDTVRKLAVMDKVNRVTCYLKAEQADAVRKLALAKGCIVNRGPYAGQGSISKLLQEIAEGKLTVVRLSKT